MSANPFPSLNASTVWPGPVMHVAIGGLVAAIVAAPLITNPFDLYAPPNPFGYLVVLLGLPLGGLVYRFRSRKLPIDAHAKRNRMLAIVATFLIPLSIAMIVGFDSGYKMFALTGIGFLVAISAALAIISYGIRRPLKTS